MPHQYRQQRECSSKLRLPLIDTIPVLRLRTFLPAWRSITPRYESFIEIHSDPNEKHRHGIILGLIALSTTALSLDQVERLP